MTSGRNAERIAALLVVYIDFQPDTLGARRIHSIGPCRFTTLHRCAYRVSEFHALMTLETRPGIRFLFIMSGFCLGLPQDPASRNALASGYRFRSQRPGVELHHPGTRPCPTPIFKPAPMDAGLKMGLARNLLALFAVCHDYFAISKYIFRFQLYAIMSEWLPFPCVYVSKTTFPFRKGL